jgi:hypothetical protein
MRSAASETRVILMSRLFRATWAIALAAAFIVPAAAADLPEVKVSDSNKVPACATPGRLMAYLHARNPRASERFEEVGIDYMRYGEELGIRWDMAFFQMILETGALKFDGDVRSSQNNFAGLGASGGGNRGERFASISDGVKAHLQHLLMYAGEHINDPVAERTRKVQEWGVLTDWQRSINGPMTFTLVAKQWAPGSRGYVRDLATIRDGFYEEFCDQPDPHPEMVAQARGGRSGPATQVAAAATDKTAAASAKEGADASKGAQIAQKAIEEARKEDQPIASLGAGGGLGSVAARAQEAAVSGPAQTKQAEVTVLNSPKTVEPANKTAPKTETAAASVAPAVDSSTDKGASVQTAAITGAATQMKIDTPSVKAAEGKPAGKCKVWTASYGGQRAILIRADDKNTVNYTVLDVNAATEKREVDAYIAAYAKGGKSIGSFQNQTRALDKAFELCPEG